MMSRTAEGKRIKDLFANFFLYVTWIRSSLSFPLSGPRTCQFLYMSRRLSKSRLISAAKLL